MSSRGSSKSEPILELVPGTDLYLVSQTTLTLQGAEFRTPGSTQSWIIGLSLIDLDIGNFKREDTLEPLFLDRGLQTWSSRDLSQILFPQDTVSRTEISAQRNKDQGQSQFQPQLNDEGWGRPAALHLFSEAV